MTKINIKEIVFQDPSNLINQTQYTQLSIFCASSAIYKVLDISANAPDFIKQTRVSLGVGGSSSNINTDLFTDAAGLPVIEGTEIHFEKNEYHLLSHRPRKTKRITSSKNKKPVNYIYQSWINPFTFKCNRVNLIFPENNSQINVVYKNREEINGYSSPMDIEIELSNSETKYNITIDFRSIKYDLSQKFPFNKINNDYKLLNFNE